ncbi:hypothetical protein GCM10011344_04120 [Dokdonia pacifica]|uniref:ABC transporter permease n=1 Tax=Dokdonia pacifica TaxID=1627892 RepID=A0A238ZJF6_9FLAO|nr:hypothetical protein [Dokdonia pacifica]GGG06809.1 hypothetical protein GCM10011344_04120 [Dokdonia pacifica]SNR83292.1 hypothetical protein SAMN06265376_103273 [Dokdonia pacifica]
MSKSIKEQKKEIIARDIERLQKQNRSFKKLAPYSITFLIILSFIIPILPRRKGSLIFENLDYIEASLVNLAVLFVFFVISVFLVIRLNTKKIDRLKKTVL